MPRRAYGGPTRAADLGGHERAQCTASAHHYQNRCRLLVGMIRQSAVPFSSFLLLPFVGHRTAASAVGGDNAVLQHVPSDRKYASAHQ